MPENQSMLAEQQSLNVLDLYGGEGDIAKRALEVIKKRLDNWKVEEVRTLAGNFDIETVSDFLSAVTDRPLYFLGDLLSPLKMSYSDVLQQAAFQTPEVRAAWIAEQSRSPILIAVAADNANVTQVQLGLESYVRLRAIERLSRGSSL